MRNAGQWLPSKFTWRDGENKWIPLNVAPGSSFVGLLQVEAYKRLLCRNVATGSDVLEIGSGRMPYFGIVRDLGVRSYTTTDIEVRGDAVRHLDLMADGSVAWPVRGNSQDVVLALDVIEHLPDQDAFFSEAARVLRPGGKLLAAWPLMYWLHEEPHDYCRLTEHGFAAATRRAGLSVVECEPYAGGLDVVIDLGLKGICNFWANFTVAGRPLQKVSSAARSIALVEEFARRSPIGYVAVATNCPARSNTCEGGDV